MVTLDVESINGRFITLTSALFTGLTLKTTLSLHVYCIEQKVVAVETTLFLHRERERVSIAIEYPLAIYYSKTVLLECQCPSTQ